VPAALALPFEKPRPALLKYLAFAMLLAANRVVTKNERERKDAPVAELHLMAAA